MVRQLSRQSAHKSDASTPIPGGWKVLFCVPAAGGAGDMDREPLEPVGLGVGLKCGVVARPAPPLPPESLLF
ncbi:jg12001 [Pararge aegeria aegeria]|uniref:Jg12001 protein n=1 Tax=Pararge aegeria aegeria TaxID=348720 RepID=A0A8S4R6G8_9NEOP|nr:jg12001 [Pararge aegeria aegeria]